MAVLAITCSRDDLLVWWDANVQHERELAVWSFPHFVRYLRALIYELTPQPHRCAQTLFEALDHGDLDDPSPTQLRALQSDPPKTHGRAQVARMAVNAICDVIGYAHGYRATTDVRVPEVAECYQRALQVAKGVETNARAVGITHDQLHRCAVVASLESSMSIDVDRQDAALAALSAGHFKLAHEIITRDK